MASLSRRFFAKQCQLNNVHALSRYASAQFSSTQQKLFQDKPTETRHLLKISDLSNTEISNILDASQTLKSSPKYAYNTSLENKTLLMLFEKASLRTRVSFEVGMEQLGGHAIFYSMGDSPLGGKETFSDTGACLSRYCDGIMARVKKREHLEALAENSTIPVINGLDDHAHPCQMLADLLTIKEYKIEQGGHSSFSDLKFAYFGDIHNNVTYDLMRACSLMGFKECVVCGPTSKGHEYNVEPGVMEECNQINNGCKMTITEDVVEAATGTDVIYTDSWMSYGILKELQEKRMEIFAPYRVTTDILRMAKPDVIFMNCLPAMRGMEQTADVIDGERSVVFDQAENRLHAQKALLLFLFNGDTNVSNLNIYPGTYKK